MGGPASQPTGPGRLAGQRASGPAHPGQGYGRRNVYLSAHVIYTSRENLAHTDVTQHSLAGNVRNIFCPLQVLTNLRIPPSNKNNAWTEQRLRTKYDAGQRNYDTCIYLGARPDGPDLEVPMCLCSSYMAEQGALVCDQTNL